MTTIDNIKEGKSDKNYLKLDDLGEEAFVVTESIDPMSTEIRIEKVPNKNKKKNDDRDTIEYFHIGGRLGDVEKDLSLTYTALKQLAVVMPGDENWKGHSFQYKGKRGSGENIKYNFQPLGKKEIPQQRINEITDPSGALLMDLKKAAGWEDNAFWDMVGNHVKTLSEGTQLVRKLKTEGRIVQDKSGMWKAV